jgi:hypothetical protein
VSKLAKEQTNVSLDADLKRKAKEAGLNITEELELWLKIRLRPKEGIEHLKTKRKAKMCELKDLDELIEKVENIQETGVIEKKVSDEEVEKGIIVLLDIWKANGVITPSQYKFQSQRTGVSVADLTKMVEDKKFEDD